MADNKIFYHKGDLPNDVVLGKEVSVDTETMGLNLLRDRLCVVQLSSGDGTAHVVQLDKTYNAPNLKRIFADKNILKIFHFARFDVSAIKRYLGVECAPVFCTKIASKLCRTSAARHGLKNLCYDLLGVELDKEQQTSDWGAEELSEAQLKYAANDVLYLNRAKDKLEVLLAREGRRELAYKCFEFLNVRGELDLLGWADDNDIFSH